MAKTKFTDEEIRDGIIAICNKAVGKCHRAFHTLRKKKNQGLEKIFHQAFSSAVDFPGWTAKDWVNRASFETVDRMRPRGWVDGVITHEGGHQIGIEFKVCQFPRMNWQSATDSMYDVGQLAWDFGSLTKVGFPSGYCIAVLHGGLVEMPGVTRRGIARSFHNAMFTDFQAAMTWGRFKYSRRSGEQKYQMDAIQKMGFDKPYYSEKVNPNNFCRFYEKHRLAVVGLSIK